VGAFAYKVGSALSDMRTQAHDIKFGAALTNLDPQQFQRFYLAGASAESVAKGIEHVAKAQQAVKTGGTGAKDALENFSQFGVTVRDIQSLSYQDLFVKIAENMHVAQLSGEQLTAGVQLMGKSFEDMQVVAKRGLDNVADSMRSLTNEQIKTFSEVDKRFKVAASLWSEAFRDVGGQITKLFTGTKGLESLTRSDEEIAAEKKLQELFNERTRKRDEAHRKDKEATFDKEKKGKELHHREATEHQTRIALIKGDLNAAQQIGAAVSANSVNSVQNMALREAQSQTVILRDIRKLLQAGDSGFTVGPGGTIGGF